MAPGTLLKVKMRTRRMRRTRAGNLTKEPVFYRSRTSTESGLHYILQLSTTKKVGDVEDSAYGYQAETLRFGLP
jgi:hypothetical protein